jgi:hypothetical protein
MNDVIGNDENSGGGCAVLENSRASSSIGGDKRAEQDGASGTHHDRLSVARCRELIGEGEKQLDDEDVVGLRDFLYRLADIICCDIERTQSKGRDGEVCDAA